MHPAISDTDMPPLYVDHAATTPLAPAAAQALDLGHALVGNPSSSHEAGRKAAAALHDARQTVARLLGVELDELMLTSGGSEANTTALWGTFAARGFTGHLVTTSIEHSSVLENAYALSDLGVAVTIVDPLPTGHIAAKDMATAIRPDTALISLMHANNETGALQPIEDVSSIARQRGIALHVDAVHTCGKLDLSQLEAELISVSAHKFGGPRGMGALTVRRGHRLSSMIRGGAQEHGLRAGTENVAGAMSMAAAFESSRSRISASYRETMQCRRKYLIDGISQVGGVHVNTPGPGIAETISLRLDGIRADAVVDALDMYGIYASTGSACHAGQDSVSHVLTAQGLSESAARATVRFSLGPDLSIPDIDRIVAATVTTVERLRRIAGTTGAAR